MKGIFGRKGNGGREEERRKPSAKVFGVPLNDVCTREQASIPLIAEETIEYLEKRATLALSLRHNTHTHTPPLSRMPHPSTLFYVAVFCDDL